MRTILGISDCIGIVALTMLWLFVLLCVSYVGYASTCTAREHSRCLGILVQVGYIGLGLFILALAFGIYFMARFAWRLHFNGNWVVSSCQHAAIDVTGILSTMALSLTIWTLTYQKRESDNSWRLSVTDILDPHSFYCGVRESALSTASIIIGTLSSHTKDLCAAGPTLISNRKAKSALVRELNKLIATASLFDLGTRDIAFVSRETRRLMRLVHDEPGKRRLNRIVLSDLFPSLVRRNLVNESYIMLDLDTHRLYLTREDFEDLPGFVSTVAVAQDAFSIYLRSRFSAEISKIVERRSPLLSREDELRTVEELNRICEGELLYQSTRFPAFHISDANRSLFRANLTGENVVRQNRILLEEVYPTLLVHDPGNSLELFRELRTDGTIQALEHSIDVARNQLDRSRCLPDTASDRVVQQPQVVYVSEGIIGEAILGKPSPKADARLVGETRSAPSCIIWGSAHWELRVHFSIHNAFTSDLNVYDMHAEVYHVSADRISPAMMIYRPRIELMQDNSILTQRRVVVILPQRLQPIELAFETSVYDARNTTIIFGIFIDWHVMNGGSLIKCRMPSDKIYVFEHESDWAAEKCRVNAYNEADLRHIEEQDPQDTLRRHRCDSLRQIFRQHSSRGRIL